MAVTFATLFGRLGKLFAMSETIRSNQSGLRTKYSNIINQYSDADMDMVGNLTARIEDRINDGKLLQSLIQQDDSQTLINMMDDALIAVSGGAGLPKKNVQSALRELIRQMDYGNIEIDGTTITIATPSAGASNQGNGELVLSALASQAFAPGNTDSPSVRTELVRARCTEDSNGRIGSSSERFLLEGQRAEGKLDEDWPRGSGTKYSFYAANPDFEQGTKVGQNVLRNSNFNAFTSNVPDYWVINTGSAGSDVTEDTSGYRGGSALKITGDGSDTTTLTQTINDAGGTLGRLKPDTLYTLSFALKRSGTSPSAGNLRIRVWDGSNTLNNSDANRKMETSLAHNNVLLTTDWKIIKLVCMTPRTLPSKGSRLEIKTDTAFNSGVILHIDDVCLAEMHRPFPGGLACQIIPGSTDFAFEDFFTCQVTNNDEGKFAREFDRFFPMNLYGYGLPCLYDGNEDIDDGLIA